MKPYRYVHLDAASEASLDLSYRTDLRHHVREKCLVILLSHKGHKISELALMFKHHSDTIRDWFDAYAQSGVAGFGIKPGRGVKPKLSPKDAELETFIKKSDSTAPKAE